MAAFERHGWRFHALIFIALVAVALLLRSYLFGIPVLQIDEEFYLVVGDRMWSGAVPYQDIWDRKPVGIFLIYAAIRLLGGEGIVQYQVVATLFAAATAFTIYMIARRIANTRGALAAGVLYLAGLAMFQGYGGQTPVFYNLFMALGALFVLRAADSERSNALFWNGVVAMALAGLAIQVKYSAVFEGFAFGLALMWLEWRRSGFTPYWVAKSAIWASVGLLPTFAALVVFAAMGLFDEFMFANFLSVFDRQDVNSLVSYARLVILIINIAPLLVLALWSRRIEATSADRALAMKLIGLWMAVAFFAVIAFGSYYIHYGLPLLVPTAVLASRALGSNRKAQMFGLFALAFMLLNGWLFTSGKVETRGEGKEVRAMAAIINDGPAGCLFLFQGEPILYQLTGRCTATKFSFPSHLRAMKESGAIGIDQVEGLRDMFATKPRYVVGAIDYTNNDNPAAIEYFENSVNRDYRLVAEFRKGERGRRLWERRQESAD